jgi:hypothetical protein
MTFRPKNFRRITDDSKPSFKIRTADRTTLVLVKSSGEAEYGRTRGDKDQLVAQFDPDADLLLWAWVGEHHTDTFLLTQEDVDLHYK